MRNGFTIIELIIVIAIIAVLAAVVMVNVIQYINESKIAAIQSEMTEFRKMAVIYASEVGSYDNSFLGCASYNYNCPEVIGSQLYDLWKDITSKIDQLPGASGSTSFVANNDLNNFCMSYVNGSVYWCVDNLGIYQDIPQCGGAKVTCH